MTSRCVVFSNVLFLPLFLQLQATDSVYATPSLREFIAAAATANRAPPLSLAGYSATVESELSLILRDSLGREMVGQIEQLAANAEWERTGRYELHVVGFRAQSMGAPYSALTWTRMYTVPTLYGNRLVLGINDGVSYTRRDTALARQRLKRDTSAGREPFRTVHPLATDRDRYYRFSGGDTIATLYSNNRAIRVSRVHVTPVMRPTANFAAFEGEVDFDADRHQLIRMRGRLVRLTNEKDPLFVRGTGAVAVAFMEFENVEVGGRYWLPAYQRSEFQASMGLLGDTRPIYRIVSRFRNYRTLGDSTDTLTVAAMDSLPRTRSRLTFASRDSVSHFGTWEEPLGSATGSVTSNDFDDLAPDVWKKTGRPRVDYWPRRTEDIVRYNRVEGMFTGAATVVRFRDAAPGLTARGSLGWAWQEQTLRGGASVSLARGKWTSALRAERTLAWTNDFMLPLESGLGIGPLIGGIDDQDYVDRWTATASFTRVLRHVDHALFTVDLGFGRDVEEVARLKNGVFGSQPFRANRNAATGNYGIASATLEWHPRVSGMSLAPGLGARARYDVAAGDLAWQRARVGLYGRQYWSGLMFASALDGDAVFGSAIPPQQIPEIGGGYDLPSYDYKEFAGDRAAIGRGIVAENSSVCRFSGSSFTIRRRA